MIFFDSYDIPHEPGVYFFKDSENIIIYIGKAKNLHKRLQSYNTDKLIDWKLQYLLNKSISLEWIVTGSEKEALLLEAESISNYKPLCNKLLTSNTPFSYIVFKKDKKMGLGIVVISRYFDNKKDFVVGPFLKKKEAFFLYEYIVSIFNLNLCKNKIKNGCLYYHLGKCAGICKEEFDFLSYKKRYSLAIRSLQKPADFYSFLDEEIRQAEKKLDLNLLETLYSYKTEYQSLALYLEKLEKNSFDQSFFELIFKIDMDEAEYSQAVKDMKSIFQIEADAIEKIDCVDISHFQGQAVSGAVVRFTNGVYDQDHSVSYFLGTQKNNDYENLVYLVKKHYIENSAELPDLLMIDGGKGQFSAVKELSLPVAIIALAKREEEVFCDHSSLGIHLSLHTFLGRLLISLRNATHNAAIRLHKKMKLSEFFQKKK
jgi:excinuclease UvrABC nuclease subunit